AARALPRGRAHLRLRDPADTAVERWIQHAAVDTAEHAAENTPDDAARDTTGDTALDAAFDAAVHVPFHAALVDLLRLFRFSIHLGHACFCISIRLRVVPRFRL